VLDLTKIALIGAGGHFTPGILRDLMRSDALSGVELCLMDIDAKSLELTRAVSERMVKAAGSDIVLSATTERSKALESAEYVITSILVGGLELCKTDIEIPLKYGVYQTVGDTVGPGGLIRALRTIPPMVEIARDMDEICPRAWLFNYSNPLTCLSIAVREASGIKMLGLCHGVRGTVHELMGFTGSCIDEFKALGVNHLTWLLDLKASGVDLYPEIRQTLADKDVPGWPISSLLCRRFGYFPSPGDRHIAEFFPYFLTEETGYGTRYGLNLRDIDSRMRSKEERSRLMAAQARGDEPLGDLTKPSGERVISIIESMVQDRGLEFAVNLPNLGYVANLPEAAVIELNALVGSDGVRPIRIGRMPENLAGLTQYRIAQQEMVVRSALTGDRGLALQALILDPLTRSVEEAGRMLDELLDASSAYVPEMA
jgi:alpha-galactosidase